jgi:hypothetical protein
MQIVWNEKSWLPRVYANTHPISFSYIKVFSLFFLIENIWLIQCRYLFNLKKKVKNKTHVEASICEAYIVEEISTFISYYFEPHLRMKINRVPRHDDDDEVSSSGNLSILSNPERPTHKNVVRGRYLSEIEFIFSNPGQNNYLKCHYHRCPYRQTNVRRHFIESWKIITWNATITDVHTDGQTSIGISQRVEK